MLFSVHLLKIGSKLMDVIFSPASEGHISSIAAYKVGVQVNSMNHGLNSTAS